LTLVKTTFVKVENGRRKSVTELIMLIQNLTSKKKIQGGAVPLH
jgi:hypothetical protein